MATETMNHNILTRFHSYDVDDARDKFCGWIGGYVTELERDLPGYSLSEYFDHNGAYKGRDIYGVQPVFLGPVRSAD